MATIEPLQQHDIDFAIEKGDVDTFIVAFTDVQGRLQGTRVSAVHYVADVATHGTLVPTYLLSVDPEMRTASTTQAQQWDAGFGDMVMRPDPTAFFRVPWQPSSVGVLCDLALPDGSPVAPSPRWVLRKMLQKVDMAGYSAFVGAEPEFVVFDESVDAAARAGFRGLTAATPAGGDHSLVSSARVEPVLSRVRHEMTLVPMGIEGSTAARAAGQFRVSLTPEDPVLTADRLTILKNAVKVIAGLEGASVTFMARYGDDTGSCAHFNINLRGSRGNAALADRYGDSGLSEIGKAFVSGLVQHAPDLMLLYAPTTNSYRRYADDVFAPSTASWGADNRSCAFRITGADAGLRIENRIAGSDANPYLAIAAMLASGVDGILRKLNAGPAAAGDAHDDGPPLPRTLDEAVNAWSSSAWVGETFGTDVQKQYADLGRAESAAAVHSTDDPWDWERTRYFDRY